MDFIFFILPLMIIFIIIFLLLFLMISRNRKHSRSVKRSLSKFEESPYRKKPAQEYRPHNERYAKLKDQKREQGQKSDLEKQTRGGVQKYDLTGRDLNQQQSQETEIVGLVEPVGFWTRLIMATKMSNIIARVGMQNRNKSGYWVNLIKANSLSQGKSQGRGK